MEKKVSPFPEGRRDLLRVLHSRGAQVGEVHRETSYKLALVFNHIRYAPTCSPWTDTNSSRTVSIAFPAPNRIRRNTEAFCYILNCEVKV